MADHVIGPDSPGFVFSPAAVYFFVLLSNADHRLLSSVDYNYGIRVSPPVYLDFCLMLYSVTFDA